MMDDEEGRSIEADWLPAWRDLHERIDAHPGTRAHRAWRGLAMVFQALGHNEAALMFVLDFSDGSLGHQALFSADGQKGESIRELYYSTLYQHVANYVGMAKVLVDAARRVFRQYEGTPFMREYEDRVLVLRATQENVFIQQFRNYVVHGGIPPFQMTLNYDRNVGTKMFAQLDAKRMLESGEFTGSAKEYLLSVGEVNLAQCVSVHAGLIREFYAWVFEQFGSLHSADIHAVNQLIAESRKLTGADGVR
ncbi:hypothetical protein [Agromyces sp. NPDC049794]|uniref:hypothetical protein n=1 Tax=unclassified Agromyces TaxID=2639701 RepID=UPI0033DD1AA3